MANQFTFIQFLTMGNALLEAKKKEVKIPKPKPRPPKTLWFQDQNLWHNDLNFAHGGKFGLSTEEEEQTPNIYATDPDHRVCYGLWQGKQNRGVTFHKPLPLHAVKHPRTRIRHVVGGNVGQTNLRK